MGQAKQRQLEEEYLQAEALRKKLEGYRKHLEFEGTYVGDCLYCGEALSREDIKKTECIHCHHELPYGKDD